MEHKCCAEVWGRYDYHKCSRAGRVERDGKWYCKQHDPVEVERKRKESQELRSEEVKELNEAWKRQQYALSAVEGISTEALKEGIVKSLRDCLKSALDTAEFEKHPFRPWHEEARNLLAKLEVK